MKIKKFLTVKIHDNLKPFPRASDKLLQCSICSRLRPIVEWNTSNINKLEYV